MWKFPGLLALVAWSRGSRNSGQRGRGPGLKSWTDGATFRACFKGRDTPRQPRSGRRERAESKGTSGLPEPLKSTRCPLPVVGLPRWAVDLSPRGATNVPPLGRTELYRDGGGILLYTRWGTPCVGDAFCQCQLEQLARGGCAKNTDPAFCKEDPVLSGRLTSLILQDKKSQ